MWRSIFKRGRVETRSVEARQRAIFLWALLISAIGGAIEFGRPLEDLLQGGRDTIRSQDYKGNVTVVAVDDSSIAALGGVDYPRRYDAQAIDRLFASGARRVIFDKAYADPSNPADDEAFVEALKRHKGKVFLGTMKSWDPRTGVFTMIEPQPMFKENVKLVLLQGKTSPFSLTAKFPFSLKMNDVNVVSIASLISGREGPSEEYFRPDWSIRMAEIPTVSLQSVVSGNFTGGSISGRDILVAPTSTVSKDVHRIVHQGWFSGGYFHVVAAETLRRGMPSYWSWLPPFLLAALSGWLFLRARRNFVAGLILVGSALTLTAVPLYLDTILVTVDVMPSLLLIGTIAIRGLTLRRVKESSETNIISGLPNFAALQQMGSIQAGTLIAMKITNLAEITASFDESVEREVFNEIRRRVGLSGDNQTVYQGEDNLMWLSPLAMGEELASHIEGLNALFLTSLIVDERQVDLSISFGIDADHDRPLTSRIGSAVLCAEEAAVANEIWKLYDPRRRHAAAWQLSLLSRLDAALENGEIWVAFQPQLDLASNRLTGAEALVRWSHPERGLIGPDEFLPLAEKHNRLEKLTAFVLDGAVAAAASIGPRDGRFSVSVNLPVQLLEQPGLLEVVASVLDKYTFAPDRLILEVTETGRLNPNGSGIKMMHALAGLGVELSIDDYGTGNATLDYLQKLPAHEIKIDRQFISNIASDEDSLILVRSTVGMVHSLGRRVVAEGVETQSQLEVLRVLGCDSAQGYLIGRPMPFGDLRDLLAISTGLHPGRINQLNYS